MSSSLAPKRSQNRCAKTNLGLLVQKNKHQCKAKFPKKLNLVPKVICPGNCRKLDLRVSGRRNALGQVVGKRTDEWLSGTLGCLSGLLRCNTHTGPNHRVPLLPSTHDPECKKDCLSKKSLARMIACAQRAQRNTTGYYSGYITKRQPIGQFQLRQAARNLQHLASSINHRSATQQFHHVANRMLGDLEFRGHVRPATEEFNLAGNYDATDVTNAEFVRTYQTRTFHGAHLLHRLRYEQTEQAKERSMVSKVLRPFFNRKRPDSFTLSFEDAYGYRGDHPHLYYLNPWEFCKWWRVEYLKPPGSYSGNPKTRWTKKNAARELANSEKPPGEKLPAVAGVHYVVIEPESDAYVTFKNLPATAELRHRAVLVRNDRPKVPAPERSPMPSANKSEEERCRIFSVYLRPWVLDRNFASPHVPHIVDLDLEVSAVNRVSQPGPADGLRRFRGKWRRVMNRSSDSFSRLLSSASLPRSFVAAWSDYKSQHVVSHHAQRVIRNFLLTQLAESAEAAEPDDDDDDDEKKGRSWEEVDTSWVSLDIVHKILNTGQALRHEGEERKLNSRQTAFQTRMKSSMSTTHKTFSSTVTSTPDAPLKEDGFMSIETKTANQRKDQVKRTAPKTEGVTLFYDGYSVQKANTWLQNLCALPEDPKVVKVVPSAEQLSALRRIMERCKEEHAEEQREKIGTSEPLRGLLHGVPGAGKSQFLLWVKDFFLQVCAWQHGVQFVFLASQNTMCALIGGFTLHSWGQIVFRQKDGTPANTKKRRPQKT